MEQLTVKGVEHAEIGAAKIHRLAEHRVEHGYQVAGRAADDAQNFGGRGLLFQGFGKFPRSRLYLIEQASIFDRDHRLIGEGAQQLNVTVGKCSGLLASYADQADRTVGARQRCEQQTAKASRARDGLNPCCFPYVTFCIANLY